MILWLKMDTSIVLETIEYMVAFECRLTMHFYRQNILHCLV